MFVEKNSKGDNLLYYVKHTSWLLNFHIYHVRLIVSDTCKHTQYIYRYFTLENGL